MINQVHTSCKDCAFSVYSDKTQTGCSAGMLDKYKDAGAEVIEVYDDSDKEFFVINNKLCTHHRDKEWAKQYTKSELLNIVYYTIIFYISLNRYSSFPNNLGESTDR